MEEDKKEYLEDVVEGLQVNPDANDAKPAEDQKDPSELSDHEKAWAEAHDIDVEDK